MLDQLADYHVSFVLDLSGSTATEGSDFRISSDGQTLSSPYELPFPDDGDSLEFTITGIDDCLLDAGESINISVDWTWGVSVPDPFDGGEQYLTGTSTLATYTVTVNDDDEAGLVFSPSSVDVDEGSTATYTVKLGSCPSSNVTVAVASSDTDEATVNKSSLTFTTSNWNTAQTVTVSGVHDDDAWDESLDITHEASGASDYSGVSEDLDVDVEDDDEAGIRLSRSSLTVDEGSTRTYSVELETKPKGTVTVSVASSDTDEATVNKSSLTFTTSNWDDPQDVRVTGVHDDDAWDEMLEVRHSASGASDYSGVSEDLDVDVDDDDEAGIRLSRSSLTVDEGSTRTYSVELETKPKGTVTVSVASSDTDEATVNKSSLTFTTSNWDDPQDVRVTGVHDDDAWDESLDITHEASGASDYTGVSEDLDVDVDDDDEAGLIRLSPIESWTVDEGLHGVPIRWKLATKPKGKRDGLGDEFGHGRRRRSTSRVCRSPPRTGTTAQDGDA